MRLTPSRPSHLITRLLWGLTGAITLSSLPEIASLQMSHSIGTASILTPAAQARSIRYIPPGRRGAPTKSVGGGSRNCGAEVPPVTLLAPMDHVGLTTQARPKLMWYSTKDSVLPMKLTIVEPGMSEPLWTQELPNSHAGVNEIQLPDNFPDLVVGRRYRWSLSRICSMRRNNDTLVVRGWIERVAMDPVRASFTAGTSLDDRVQAYAEAGLWYDAIAQATSQGDSSKARMTPQLLALLEQSGIQMIVQQEQKRAQVKGIRHDSGSSSNLNPSPSR